MGVNKESIGKLFDRKSISRKIRILIPKIWFK